MPSNTQNTVSDASAIMGDKLSGAASQVKSKASELGHSAADYIREKDVSGMMTDLARLVKNNPGPAMLCAAALGFLVARSFSDD